MRLWLPRNILIVIAAGALLIFAIRMFENAFMMGRLSVKIYMTIIGIIFLAAGAFAAAQVIRRKTIVQYMEKESPVTVHANNLLTDRECEILKGIASGLTNREIGLKLFVSENTVKKHINNIYIKLDVRRRTQAIARAKELKILSEA
ncbi:MAG TPA: response regulator transcription factor [Flavisolibacter sp.]